MIRQLYREQRRHRTPTFRLLSVRAEVSAGWIKQMSWIEVEGRRDRYLLKVAPNPAIDWNSVPSLMTISAPPIGPGVTKLMGEEGASEVKSFDLSHVVCHCDKYCRQFQRCVAEKKCRKRTTSQICCEYAGTAIINSGR